MAVSPGDSDWLNLTGPTSTTEDLLPLFKWEFESPNEIEEISLFVSVFEENKGLLPWDNFVEDFSSPNGNPFLAEQGLTKGEQIDLLSQPWEVSQYRQEDDFNPNRILTVTWKKDEAGTGGTWYWGDGSEIYDTDATPISFELEEERTLTVGQTYYWGVEAYRQDGDIVDQSFASASFKLEPTLPEDERNTFSSASIITHGFKPPLFDRPGIPEAFYQLGGDLLDSQNGGLIMRYDRPTGYWVPVDEEGRIPGDFPAGLKPSEPGYKDALLEYLLDSDDELKDKYRQKPLVLLSDWSGDNESGIPDSGFSEAAADSIFSSLVQLDQWLGGSVGSLDPTAGLYDANGNLIRNQGALFNSPLHFIGFSRGTVVNSEMIQRLGTFFPFAGGTDADNRDLQMTTLDPHDFNQPSLDVVEVKLPLVDPIELDYSDFFEPKVQVWERVTFADNYYQTVPDLEGRTLTPAGRDIPRLPETDEYGNPWPREGWRSRNPDPNAPLLGFADVTVRLGANPNDNENYLSSRGGFTKETDPIKFGDIEVFKGLGGVHGRVVSWYGGSSNLGWEGSEWDGSQKNVVFRRKGDPTSQELFDKEFYDRGLTPRFNPWYVPNHEGVLAEDELESLPSEGIGSGWFYSVLGGGKDLRPETDVDKVPVDFDNTDSERMRGDFAVPTLFNGNFDAVTKPHDFVRNAVSNRVPGWSVDSGSSVNVNSLQENLVEWSDIGLPLRYRLGAGYDGTTANYALKLDSNFKEVTHNPFVIPEWGNLRFDVYAPEKSGKLNIQLEVEGANIPLKTIDLALDAGTVKEEDRQKVSKIKEIYGNNVNSIGSGRKDGFETFQFPFQKLSSDEWNKFIGKPAKLTFTLEGDSEVFIDNVFFKSAHVKLGNPTNARWDATQETPTNLLVEKPGYTVSYNTQTKTPNWVSWQVNKTWTVPGKTRLGIQFIDDPFFSLQSSHPNWPKVDGEIFKGLGMDKGHLIPDRDRNRNPKDTIETYMGSNLIAQSMDNNRRFNQVNPPIGSAWFNIEKLIGNGVEAGKEYYVVAGSLGNDWSVQKKSNAPELLENPLNQGDTKPKKFNNNIFIPEWTWKSAIALPKPGMEITLEAEAFVYITPNHAEPTDNELPIKHPLNQLLGEERGFIENREEWRNPETWRVTLQQLQDLLNSRKDHQNPEETDPRFNFQFDFLSHITNQSVQQKLMKDGESVISCPDD